MESIRIIPRLDIKGPNLVKGIHLEGLRVLGRPGDFARYYYEHGADELIYMDAVASLYERNSLLGIVEQTAKELFVPLTVGGGLRSIDDMRAVLLAGADKLSINTAAIKRPELVKEGAEAFGSSTIVVSIEATRNSDGSYECLTDYGRERSGVDALEWATQAEALGAGELVVTSIDREGTGSGFDLELSTAISKAARIPVIAAGGAGKLEHVSEVIRESEVQAVSLASLLHYRFVQSRRASEDTFNSEGNVEFLQGRRGEIVSKNIEHASIHEVKNHLLSSSINCRP